MHDELLRSIGVLAIMSDLKTKLLDGGNKK
jgi:hypothetical protein